MDEALSWKNDYTVKLWKATEGIPALLDLDESDERKCENVVILQIKRLLKTWEKILFKVVQVGVNLV